MEEAHEGGRIGEGPRHRTGPSVLPAGTLRVVTEVHPQPTPAGPTAPTGGPPEASAGAASPLLLAASRRAVRLSLLDLVPVPRGSTPGQALRHSTRLVHRAEQLGYHRYWVAEHHSMPGIASSSPAVLLAHLATATEHMRLGSGGVMLPNHSPLVVAEQFGMLGSLHPGRIDLGLGRAPGTDGVTAQALRRTDRLSDGEDFPQQFAELVAFLDGSFPPDHPYASVRAVPQAPTRPDIWLLGSSGYSAQLAGLLGLPFSFAHHFSAANTEPALELYRRSFRPSETLDEPYAMIGVSVVCAGTVEQARWLAAPQGLSMLRMRTGRSGPQPTPEEAAEYRYTPAEKELVRGITGSHVVGDPALVLDELVELADRTGVDELMVTTNVGDADERLRSYELVAEQARGRAGAAAAPVALGLSRPDRASRPSRPGGSGRIDQPRSGSSSRSAATANPNAMAAARL